MKITVYLGIVLCSIIRFTTASENYDNFEIWRVSVPKRLETGDQSAVLELLELAEETAEIADTAADHQYDVLVSPANIDKIKSGVRKFNITARRYLEDFGKLVREDEKTRERRRVFGLSNDPSLFTLDQFHNYEEITTFLKQLATTYHRIASVFSVGYSSEGRQLLGIRIGSPTRNLNPAIWIDAGSIPRVWIGPATAVFIANQLTMKYATDSNIQQLVNGFNWYILPIANPDGYDYTWTTARSWMKTRSPGNCTFFTQCCVGVYMNRNWGYHWTGGIKPCADTYSGPNAFSEPETMAISSLLASLQGQLKAYFTFDTFGQVWQYPFSYRRQTFPPDVSNLIGAASVAIRDVVLTHNTPYTIGPASAVSALIAGTSADYAKGTLGIKYVYTIQSRPAGAGVSGYLLPANQIIPSAEENFQGIQDVVQLFNDDKNAIDAI